MWSGPRKRLTPEEEVARLEIMLDHSEKPGTVGEEEYQQAWIELFGSLVDPVVIPLARRYSRQRPSLLVDFFHEGLEAFLAHILEYDPTRGTLAEFMWIRMGWRMWSYLNLDKGIPDRVARQRNLVRRKQERLAQELGREPTVEEVAVWAGMSTKRVQQLLSPTTSLDTPDAPPVADSADTAEEMEIRAEIRREAEAAVAALRVELAQLEADHPAWVTRFATAGWEGGIRYLVLNALFEVGMNSVQIAKALNNPADPDLTKRWPELARVNHLAPYVPTTWADVCPLFTQPAQPEALRTIRSRGRNDDRFTPHDPAAWAMICHRFPKPHTTADVRRILREKVSRYLREKMTDADAAM